MRAPSTAPRGRSLRRPAPRPAAGRPGAARSDSSCGASALGRVPHRGGHNRGRDRAAAAAAEPF